MNDPRRLLEDSSTSGREGLGRWLLDAGQDVGPPAGAKAQVWGRLEGLLGPAAAGGASGSGMPDPFAGGSSSPAAGVGGGNASSAAPSTSAAASEITTIAARKTTTSLITKLGLAGMVLGGGLFVASVVTKDDPKLSADLGHDLIPATSSALEFAPADHASELDSPSAGPLSVGAVEARKPSTSKPSSAKVVASADEAPASSVMRESDGVKRARSLLASGDAVGALAELSALDREVGRGVLGPERHVLAIEAMAASGRGDIAAKQAAAFIDAHPNSPYAKRLKPIAGR